jgi:hypothetical protein
MNTKSQKKSREQYHKELQGLDLPIGSHIIVWGSWTFAHKIMTWLQYLWLGEKNAPAHMQRAYNVSQDISAEAKGVMLIDRIDSLKKADRIKIVNHKKLQEPGMAEKFIITCRDYLNTPYDSYFYFLVVLRIFTFFLPFALIWTLFLNMPFLIPLIVLLIILYWPVRRYLTAKSKYSWACSELCNSIDRNLGIDTGIDVDHNTSPNYYYRLSRASSDFRELYDSGWIASK